MEEQLTLEDPIEALLARATVRVKGGGKGSGFFVAPGNIVSCAHVVGRTNKPGTEVSIVRLDGSESTARIKAIDPGADVAFLSTQARDGDVIVMLDDDALLGDGLLLYGFPQGVATTRLATYEGGEGPPGPSRLKHLVKGTQVIGGFSGGPLVNLRTLAAIGVMAETRDERLDLGGYAVPVARLREALPEIGVLLDAQSPAVREQWLAAKRARQQRIDERLQETAGVETALPGAAAIAAFIARYRQLSFAGRHREFATLDAWIDARDAPSYRLITAPAGRGKSALVVNWIAGLAARSQAIKMVFVPISLRDQLTGEAEVLSALAARLAAAWSIAAPNLGASLLALRDFIALTLARPLPEGQRAIVVIDAIDEAAGWSFPGALLPHAPDAGVRVLLTARATAERDAASWCASLGLDTPALCSAHSLEKLTRDDIAVLVRRSWPKFAGDPETIIDALLDASDSGDPLVVQLFAETYANDPEKLIASALDRTAIQPGLDRFFTGWWSDQQAAWGKHFAKLEPAARIVFNLLALALAPIGRSALLALARRIEPALDGDTLDEALALLNRFIVRSDDEFVLAHPRFAEHRRLRLERDGDDARYKDAFRGWAETAFANEEVPVDPYLVRNWALQLEAMGAKPEAFRFICTRRWQQAWDRTGDDEAGLTRDLRIAFSHFRDAARRAPGPPLNSFGDAWVAAFRMAERANLLARLDPEIAAPLLRYGVWSARRALSLIAASRGDTARARALAALIPILPVPLLRDAERVLESLDTYDKHHLAPAWMALVRRIDAEDGRPSALVFAKNRRSGAVRGGVLLELSAQSADISECSRLAAQAAGEQATMNSIELQDFPSQIAAAFGIRVIGGRLDAEARRAAQAATFAACEHRGSLQDLLRDPLGAPAVSALARVLPWNTEIEAHGLIAQALEILTRRPSPALQIQLLLELAPFTAADQIDAAVAALDALEVKPVDEEDRLHLLTALAPAMTPEQRQEHHADLDRFAARLAPHSYLPRHVAALRALSDAGFQTTVARAAIHALSAGAYNDEAFSVVAERLDERETREALDTVRELIRSRFEIPRGAIGALTSRLATFGRAQAQEALREAERLDDTLLRRAASLGTSLRVHALGHFSELSVDLLDAVSRPASRSRQRTLRCFEMARLSLSADEAELFLQSAADEEARLFVLRQTEGYDASTRPQPPLREHESWGLREPDFDNPQWPDEFAREQDLQSSLHLFSARIAAHLRSLTRAQAETIGDQIFAALPHPDRLRVETIGRLAFVMPSRVAESLDPALIGGKSSTDRTEAFAALGARLVVLGTHARGMELLRKAPYPDGVAPHLADAVRWAPEAALRDLVNYALGRLGNADDDLALAPLAGRWHEISEPTARELADAWFETIAGASLPAIFAQLPNFIDGIERLGWPDALEKIAYAL